MKIVSLVDSPVGLIQALALSHALRHKHRDSLVYVGPHTELFQVRAYFEHVDLLEPDVNLELGSNPQGVSFGEMLLRLERVLLDLTPDLIVVRGDSGASLAGALAAARHLIPVARLEAGVRAYSKRYPQELNRLLADRLADVLFCNTQAATRRLADEGIVAGVHFSGDVALDVVTQHLPTARQHSSILQRVGLCPGYYLLALMHSPATTQEPRYLHNVVRALNSVREPVIFSMSAHMQAALNQRDLTLAPHVLAIDPLGYLDMLSLEAHARAIITDLAAVQRDAYHLAVPCITLRDDTEAPETVVAGWNRLVGGDTDRIVDAVHDFLPPTEHPPLFGDGHAADQIAAVLSAGSIVFGQNYDRVVVPLLDSVAVN